MRHLIRLVLLAGVLAGPASGLAHAVSVEDLILLKANGLSDEVLVALIETDGSVFRLSAEDVTALHTRGLGEKVILAMIRTAGNSPEPVRTRPERAPSIQPPVAPIVVPLFVPVFVGSFTVPPVLVRPEKPVYWGFGGTLRPDAWQVAPPTPVGLRPPSH